MLISHHAKYGHFTSYYTRAGIIYHDSNISQFCITRWWIDSASIRLSTIQAFCVTFFFFLNQIINKDLMALLSDILHGLHFQSFIANVTKWKCRIYAHFVFIVNLYVLADCLNLHSTESLNIELSNDVTISIYRNIFKADINIRNV